jgi:hypothetical protein
MGMTLREALQTDEVRSWMREEVDRGVAEALVSSRSSGVLVEPLATAFARVERDAVEQLAELDDVEMEGDHPQDAKSVLEARAERERVLDEVRQSEASKRLERRMAACRAASAASPSQRLSRASREVLENLSAPEEADTPVAPLHGDRCGCCGEPTNRFADRCRQCGTRVLHNTTPRSMAIVEMVGGRTEETEAPERVEGCGRVLESAYQVAQGAPAWKERARLRGLTPETIAAIDGARGRGSVLR